MARRSTDSMEQEHADLLRLFLASVQPLDGCCVCGEAPFHRGRAAIEQLALAYEDDDFPDPSLEQCADMLHFLAGIAPMSKKICYGCAGDQRQSGLNLVLCYVRDRIVESAGKPRVPRRGIPAKPSTRRRAHVPQH